MFGRTVTLFVKKDGYWYPRVFRDTQVARDRGYIVRTYGETANEVAAVHIKRKDGLAEGMTVYEPKEWDALLDVSGAVCFKPGDVIWLGDWSTVDQTLAPISDDDQPKGFASYLRSTYDCVWTVTQASAYETLPHWEIAGR